MNDRIVELMVKASSGACYDETTPTLYGSEIEKFAELIIATCTGICEDLGTEGDGQNCVDAINDYFKG